MTKIRNKLLLAFILVSLIPLVVLGGYGLTSIGDSLKSVSIGKLSDRVSLHSLEIEDFLKNVSNDLFYLRDSVTLRSLVENLGKESNDSADTFRKNLEKDFLAFSKHKKIYYQVRYLNADGMEVVRVDRNRGESIIVPQGKLQSKKKRYYFADTAKLSNGQLMISPLDLNREHGKVERPLRPVIRYGTPIYDKSNKLQGIVLFNVNAENFLDLISSNKTKSADKLFFIDKHGFYYSNPDSRQEWGGQSDLDTGANFNQDYKAVSDQIVGSRSAVTVTEGEYIIGSTPVFLDKGKKLMLGTIVDVAQAKDVYASVVQFRNIFLGIGVLVFLVTLFLAIGLARSITNPLVYLTDATMRMSKGKLSDAISVTTKDETKLLAESIEKLRKSMIILLKRRK